MNGMTWKEAAGLGLVCIGGLFAACGGGGGSGGGGALGAGGVVAPAPAAPPSTSVKIVDAGANAVSVWNEIAINTINVPAATSGTAAEQRPVDSVDLATVHVAIYDALVAITGGYRPYAVADVASARGTDISQPAAVGSAALGVLKGLFPNRSAQYQPAYDSFVASIADGDAKVRGLAVGAEVATAILALRADDGRSVVLAAYVPGTTPGRFRGVNPINRFLPAIKPFSIQSAAQFRPVPPPALDSAVYATDVEETRTFGGMGSILRTDAQLEIARFHTEPPPRFWPRNLRRLARTDRSLVEHARLMAMMFATEADATIGCFEAKYFYEFWRPQSAIPLADTDGNAATVADPAWTPVLPTPNHPEYPAAHACVAAAVAETMKIYYGTDKVEFVFDSTVTGSTHSFVTTQAFVEEVKGARIYGGMHFRSALLRGEELGASVARWVAEHHFQRR